MLFCESQFSLLHAPVLWCDNISALALASNLVYHARTKHIEIDYHFVREKVLNRDILIKFISTNDQLADIFTKSLSSARFLLLRSKLMVTSSPISLRGAVREASRESSIDSSIDHANANDTAVIKESQSMQQIKDSQLAQQPILGMTKSFHPSSKA